MHDDPQYPARTHTVCGLWALIDVLERRAGQLEVLPERVEKRDQTGEKRFAELLNLDVLSRDQGAGQR